MTIYEEMSDDTLSDFKQPIRYYRRTKSEDTAERYQAEFELRQDIQDFRRYRSSRYRNLEEYLLEQGWRKTIEVDQHK